MVDGDLPYLPDAAARHKENFTNRMKLDPEVKCYPPGVRRATYMPYPFEMQSTRNMAANRGAPFKAPADSWMGWSEDSAARPQHTCASQFARYRFGGDREQLVGGLAHGRNHDHGPAGDPVAYEWLAEEVHRQAIDEGVGEEIGLNARSVRTLVRRVDVISAAVVACLLFSVVPVSGQAPAPAYKAPRTKDGKADLNGIWQAMNTANWDLRAHAAAQGPVLSLGARVFDSSRTRRDRRRRQNPVSARRGGAAEEEFRQSPDARSRGQMLHGRRSALHLHALSVSDRPIAQDDHDAYEYAGGVRSINMGKPTEAPADSWMGWSNGHWEGDTLVVVVTDQNDQTWFDRAGDFHSDALKVTERYTPRSADTLMYEATIEDPKTFSRPWKISMPLYRHVEKNAQIMEYKCSEFAEEVLYGKYRKQPAK